ncbi:MAG: DUF2723 domain-containing protein [Bacteroidota bacterium]
MNSFKKLSNIVGWAVFAIAMVVYYLSAERTGSLWDCGEFVAGAYKLQVVHPPGAALFLLIGRMFTYIAEIFSNNPEDIAFSVNILSGLSSALAAMLICWVTIILGRLALIGRDAIPTQAEGIALLAAGAVAGLATAFSTSVWFSAVEGEVYAMSTFFTCLTFWAGMKWYALPDTPQADRWLILATYVAGLSVGVHLLSILIFPALALFYYFKKYKNHDIKGMALAGIIGVVFMGFVQKVIVVGIPTLWLVLEKILVNDFGMPFNSGLYPTVLLITGALVFGLYYSHKNNMALLQKLMVAVVLLVISFSTIGVVVIRANANTPINMNAPSDPTRLLPYLNREQYGERPLLRGPHYKTQVESTKSEDRYGQVEKEVNGEVKQSYEIIDQKHEYVFNKNDQMLFPRLGHLDENRKALYPRWLGHNGRPTMGDNMSFFWNYQIRWMYWRYFMWNFSGRQNGDQGFYSWDPSSGHWITGINFIDRMLLFDQSNLPDEMKDDEARNTYFLLPFLFGLLGLFYHARRRQSDFLGLLALFIITGIGIIVYSNQPPNEPRERDYVLVGSFFTYCIWMGMGVLALFQFMRERKMLDAKMAAIVAGVVIMIAPLLMGFQNFDDHSRRHHKASRDYASNFLNSCGPNAIVFTYGDNDTYPLWYAQEVEGIRTDVRVVNLSLIAVDWYIEQLRRKVNDSPAIKMSLPTETIRGSKRVQIPIDPGNENREASLTAALKWLGEEHKVPLQGGRYLESYFPARTVYIPVNRAKAYELGMVTPADSNRIVNQIRFKLNKGNFMMKGDAAVLDIINSNIWDRPVYFAVTCRQESMLGIQDYTQLEGLALRIIPVRNPQEKIYGMIGNGRVAKDKFYENVTQKFKWGNFDKQKLFVNKSYGPTVQTTRYGILRAATEMMKNPAEHPKAMDLVDTYFKGFPDMNFPYDARTMLFINLYVQAGEMEKAKKHLRLLANRVEQRLNFYNALDPSLTSTQPRTAFGDQLMEYSSAKRELLRVAEQIDGQDFVNEMKAVFGELKN